MIYKTKLFYDREAYDIIQRILDDMNINACIMPYQYVEERTPAFLSSYHECCKIEFFNTGDNMWFLMMLSTQNREILDELPGGIIWTEI